MYDQAFIMGKRKAAEDKVAAANKMDVDGEDDDSGSDVQSNLPFKPHQSLD